MQNQNEATRLQREFWQNMHDIWQNDPKRCLFSPGCAGKPIKSHTVPRNILRTIQVEHHVTRLTGRTSTDHDGAPSLSVKAQNIGINQASTGPFVCKRHEDLFAQIETPHADIHDNRILDLMMYRATLLELWQQLRVTEPLSRYVHPSIPPPLRPSHKLRATTDLTDRLGPRFSPEGCDSQPAIDIKHLVRTIKTTKPIVAVAQANSSADIAMNKATGNIVPLDQTRRLTDREPNCSWSLTVIPKTDNHTVIFSCVASSEAETFFQHIATANGAELEAAVSAEIILFSENWYLNPSVWDAYGEKRQKAILSAYDNFEQLITGKYYYRDKHQSQPWYEFFGLPNRHQINLFRF